MEGLSILVWIIVAIVTAFIAAKKNRSFIGWLIIGLILPIVGFILILVLPEGQPVKDKPRVKKEMAPPVVMKEEEPEEEPVTWEPEKAAEEEPVAEEPEKAPGEEPVTWEPEKAAEEEPVAEEPEKAPGEEPVTWEPEKAS